MSLPRYEKYKDSGVEWLGEVPEHWGIVQGRRLFSQKRDPAFADDEQLSASQKYGVVPQKLFMEIEDKKVTLALSGLENFKHVERDDFVISLRSFQGGIERSQYIGCVSPAYTVLRAIKPICGSYWAQVLKSPEYVTTLQSVTDGIRDGKNISYEQFGQIWLPNPSIEDQQIIAAFLAHETAKIDALIAEQLKLIELLKEKRQAAISHAVTKGLNPDTKMKDSGIEWLGEVPEHWEVEKFGYISNVVRGASPRPAGDPKYFDGEYIPWITVAEITKDEHVYLNTTETMLTEMGSINSRIIKSGTLVLSNSGATLGVPKILAITGCANDGVIAFEGLSQSANKFFLYYFLSSLTVNLRDRIKQGSGQPNLNTDIIKSLEIPFPSYVEQTAISAHLDYQKSKINILILEAKNVITLLQERRTALISAAVTGKIDVRGLVEPPQREATA